VVTASPGVIPSLVSRPQEGATSPQRPAQRLEGVTLEQALALAEQVHPELALGQAQIARAEGRALQAGLFPNPELVARIESAPLTEHFPEQAEYVIGVSQAVPLGKRLTLARQVEMLDRERLIHDLAGKRLGIRMRVQSAFATALYGQRVIRVREEDVQSATNGVALAQARLAAGDTIPAEVAQAEVELRRAELERDKARSGAAQAMQALRAALGDATIGIESLEGAFEGALAVPALASLVARLDQSPLVVSAEADIAVQRAQIDLAHAQRIPTVNLDLFYRRIGDTENTMDVGVRLPLLLFDRAQGRIRESRAGLAAAEAQERAVRNELFLRLQTAHSKLERAIATSMLLREEILPRAESVLHAAEARYRAGDIGLSELLPVRRDWTRVRLDYLEALQDVMQAWAELSPYVRQE
jgi:cobalt-zinc-cadmium efflux system outer membrane protein